MAEGGAQTRRKRRSSEEIAQRLLDAAHAVFTEAGYAGATTAAIAARAEVTEAQLFRAYPSKAELFRAAIFEPLNRHFADFQARQLAGADSAASLRGQAEDYITELQQFIEDHGRMLLSLMVARTYGDGLGEGEITGLEDYFAQGQAMMQRRPIESLRVPPELMVRVSFAGVLGCVLFRDWLFPSSMAGDEAIRRAVIDFVLDGVNANLDPAMLPKI